ncbi:MAG TPA: hypothetical protein VHY91_08605 [Pirellulales bacterium]|nr:hypothetical protein [Pirellulales bacterium]
MATWPTSRHVLSFPPAASAILEGLTIASLFDEFRLKDVTLRNQIVVSPR